MLFVLETARRLTVWTSRQTAAEFRIGPEGTEMEVPAFLEQALFTFGLPAVLAAIRGDRRSRGEASPSPGLRAVPGGSFVRPYRQRILSSGEADGRGPQRRIGLVDEAPGLDPVSNAGQSSLLLVAIGESASSLLSVRDLDAAIPRALDSFAWVTGLSAIRVFVSQAEGGPPSERWATAGPAVRGARTGPPVPLPAQLREWIVPVIDGAETQGGARAVPEADRRLAEGAGFRSWLATPIRGREGVRGALWFEDRADDRRWTEEERAGARILAAHIGIALDRDDGDRLGRILSRAVQEGPAGIFVTDAEGRIEFVNRRFTEIYGRSEQDLLGKPPDGLQSQRTPGPRYEEVLRAAASGKAWAGSVWGESRSGVLLSFEASFSPVRAESGRTTHVVAIHDDVSARRAVETSIWVAYRRYSFLFHSVPALIFVSQRDGTALSLNRRWGEFTGRPDEATLGLGWLDVVVLEDRAALLQALSSIGSVPGPVQLECRLTRADGSARWHSVTVEAMPSDDGMSLNGLGICFDVTPSKEAALALGASRDEMSALSKRLVAVREEERVVVARELHDGVGQALTGVMLGFQALIRELGQDSRIALEARVLSGELDNALRDVRDIARRLRPAALDDGLLPALDGELKALARRSGLSCELDAPTDLVLDGGRTLALFRFAQEALTNVVRHAAAHRVVLTVRVNAGRVQMTVSDDGQGLPSTLSPTAGLGLVGLRERVAAWGGRAWLEPNQPRGTRCIATIPFGAGSSEAVP